jgi:type IV secretory pathway VirB4 component
MIKIKLKNNQPKNNNFLLGQQDHLDLISYSGLEENTHHLIINNQLLKTIFISGYPYVASTGWLNNLINYNHDIDLSYHIDLINSIDALPKLQRKITELESTKRLMRKNGKLIGPDIADPLQSAISLRDKIIRGQEKLFQIGIYITIKANSLNDLEEKTKNIETILASHLFYTKNATYQQLDAYESTLPKAKDLINQKRNLDSTALSLTFPFISSELVQENGILYGINKNNNSLVIIDRFNLNNANSIIFAQSGSGKSYAMKIEIMRQLIKDVQVIIIDPEQEYKKLSEEFDGTYIQLSTNSKQKINLFDLELSHQTKESLSDHIQNIISIISLMVDGLSSEDKSILDKAIINIYEKFKEETPILQNLYNEIQELGDQNLANRLEKFISGSLKEIFNFQTNIDLANNLIIFDIKDIADNLRQLIIMIISNFVNYQVKLNPKKRLLIIDEGWLLMQHEESAKFIAGLTRRSRKYYLGVSIISQQANDFLNNEYGKVIASQSSLRILMRQDSTTIKNVVQEFNLSEFEENFLLTSDQGEALIIADTYHVAVKITASKHEHPIITTNPNEIYQS